MCNVSLKRLCSFHMCVRPDFEHNNKQQRYLIRKGYANFRYNKLDGELMTNFACLQTLLC